MEKEKQQVIDEVSKYIDIALTPFGKPQRGVIDVEKRDPMYGGNGVVYICGNDIRKGLINYFFYRNLLNFNNYPYI